MWSIPHAPTGLNGTKFKTLKSAGLNDPEGTKNYNKTEVKYGKPSSSKFC
jgi:hypothetical protein